MDNDPFDRFYKRHFPLVWAAALARTADRCAAGDLVQETMLRAWRHFPTLSGRDDDGQRAWLLTALRHRQIEAWRRQRPTADETEASVADSDLPLRLDVARALAAMDETDRELVVLRYFAQCDSPEIGRILGMPEGTVRRRLAEARSELARRLAAWENDR